MAELNKDEIVNLNELKKKKPAELARYAAELKIEGAAGLRKQDLIFAVPHRQQRCGFF
jgi:transcription termination factor Rho